MWKKIKQFFISGAPGIKKKPEIDVKGFRKENKSRIRKTW
jgi:hypothetical protein